MGKEAPKRCLNFVEKTKPTVYHLSNRVCDLLLPKAKLSPLDILVAFHFEGPSRERGWRRVTASKHSYRASSDLLAVT